MSLVAPRSHQRAGKRRYQDDGENSSNHQYSSGHKARRLITAARRASAPAHAPVKSSVIAGLRGLYPAMDEQTIAAVLADCGSNIDAAIRKLGQLQLEAEGETKAPTAQSSPVAISPHISTSVASLQPRSPPTAASDTKTGGSSAAAPQLRSPLGESAQQQQQQQHEPQAAPQQQPRTATPAEWVEALVQSMEQATDVPDARARAGAALQAFECAVRATMQAKEPLEDSLQSQQQLAALQRDNGILKRAVAIQNSRLQDLAGVVQQSAAKDVELTQLRNTAQQYHDRIQALELSNFTLAQHLRQATDARDMDSGNRNVF